MLLRLAMLFAFLTLLRSLTEIFLPALLPMLTILLLLIETRLPFLGALGLELEGVVDGLLESLGIVQDLHSTRAAMSVVPLCLDHLCHIGAWLSHG